MNSLIRSIGPPWRRSSLASPSLPGCRGPRPPSSLRLRVLLPLALGGACALHCAGAEAVASPGASRNLPTYSPNSLPGMGLLQHPFFYTGQWDFRHPVQRMVIVRGGKIVWSYEIPTKNAAGVIQELTDATLLSNGNVVFARKTGAGEITPDGRLIWNYDAPAGCEVHVAQPIGLDRILIVRNGEPAKLMIVAVATGRIEKEFVLPTGNPHPTHTQFRRVRMTKAGTFLAAHHDQDKVVEYDADGHEIWSVAVPVPWAAVRLDNGNTLISSHNSFVREVDPQGKTVWEFSQADAPDIALFMMWKGPLAPTATIQVLSSTTLSSRPALPLARPMVSASFGSGTTWPPT